MFYAHGYDKNATESRLTLWNMIYERSGKMPKKMQEKPQVRQELMYLWNMYCHIKKGCDALTWEAVAAYKRVTACDMQPWESNLMIDIDKERLNAG